MQSSRVLSLLFNYRRCTQQQNVQRSIMIRTQSLVVLATTLMVAGAAAAAAPSTSTSTRTMGAAFTPTTSCRRSGRPALLPHRHDKSKQTPKSIHFGWLENFFEPQKSSSSSSSSLSREMQYPEQYPATYELNTMEVEDDQKCPEAKQIRPLLKNTQLQSRALTLVYDAEKDGWNPTSFHSSVDGKGAAVVVAKTREGTICGGYNPKGWASLGGARPSVAAFLFYERKPGKFQKLQKIGGGGLACARDDPSFGMSFGADGLVIGLQPGRERLAQSKLGPYFERGPEELSSIFGGATDLVELKILVGRYEPGEEIPYSGGVLDMTSG